MNPLDLSRCSRRDMVRTALAGAGILALGPLTKFMPQARGAPITAKRFVVLNLSGGNDTLNMVVPVGLATYFSRRGALALQVNQLLSLNTGPHATTKYMLHPSMQRILSLWNEGSVAFVQRTGYPTPDLSHFLSQDIFSYGVRNGFANLGVTPSGWIARFADKNAIDVMGAVSVGQGRPLDFVGGTTGHLQVDTLSAFKIRAAGTSGTLVTNAHLLRLQEAKDMLTRYAASGVSQETRDALLQAHNLADQVQTAITGYTTTVTWPNTTIALRMKDLATLVQGGFDTRLFYTGFGGFDTHGSQGTTAGAQPSLFSQLDGAIGAFSDDMKARGVWNDTVIMCITEFGRRNYVNGSAGTDHGHAWCAMLIGGAVKGGTFGPDLTDNDLNQEYPLYAVDFRSIYKEILNKHLGTDPAPVFPETLPIDTTLGVV